MNVVLLLVLGCFQTEALRLHQAGSHTRKAYEDENDHIVVTPTPKAAGQPNVAVGFVAVGGTSLTKYLKGVTEAGWLHPAFERNINIVKAHGHSLYIREISDCTKFNCDRVNANFEKFVFMNKLLSLPDVTHALILDLDTVLVQPQIDSLSQMARELDNSGRDVLVANEDWHMRHDKKKNTSFVDNNANGGMLFAKKTQYAQDLFTVLKKKQPICTNDQTCLGWFAKANLTDAYGTRYKDHILVASGMNYNFGPQVWTKHKSGRFDLNPAMTERTFDDPSLHIIHFMGSYKNMAQNIISQLPPILSSVKQFGRIFKPKKTQHELDNQLTCNDGEKLVPCLDVDKCAADAPATGRFAIVLTHDLKRRMKWPLPNMDSVNAQAKEHSMDIILMVPSKAKHSLDDDQKKELQEQNIKIVEVPWSVPPNSKFHPKSAWCGPQDLIRIHAFGLKEYDAIAYYDTDIELQGDVIPALRCASTGRVLTTMGSQSPLNLGFFALKPSSALLETAIAFSEIADFDKATGWDNAGYLPSHGKYFGAECGQGYLHTLLYKNTSAVQRAFQKTGLKLQASQIDRCAWNYQGQCPDERFDCSQVRAHHKDGHYGSCVKYTSEFKFFAR